MAVGADFGGKTLALEPAAERIDYCLSERPPR
jgi:hypothetical protein